MSKETEAEKLLKRRSCLDNHQLDEAISRTGQRTFEYEFLRGWKSQTSLPFNSKMSLSELSKSLKPGGTVPGLLAVGNYWAICTLIKRTMPKPIRAYERFCLSGCLEGFGGC
ncbi:MAG: hypothetical protein R3C24_16370 [Cyanobacteriota/Melainabacteria group bacterium]